MANRVSASRHGRERGGDMVTLTPFFHSYRGFPSLRRGFHSYIGVSTCTEGFLFLQKGFHSYIVVSIPTQGFPFLKKGFHPYRGISIPMYRFPSLHSGFHSYRGVSVSTVPYLNERVCDLIFTWVQCEACRIFVSFDLMCSPCRLSVRYSEP